jgi:hypothetical protein
VAALAKTIPFIVDHIVAEWQAMQFCYELGYRGAIFKGDSLIVVLALRQVSTCWQGFRQLLEDIKIKLNSLSFFFFFFFFCVAFSTRCQPSGPSIGQGSIVSIIRPSMDRRMFFLYSEYCTCRARFIP